MAHIKPRFLTVLTLLASFSAGYACTDLQLQADDGTPFVGRTMDFSQDLQSALAIYPRGEHRVSKGPKGQSGMEWMSRYAYAGMNELGNTQMISDGINEAGLSLADLWLAETQYPSITPNSASVLSLYDFPAWVLGNFASVAELKQQLPHIQVWGDKIAKLNTVVPLHFAIHDASGANIVIEFLHGKMQVLDNPVGVLTNSPPFNWQVQHLKKYQSLMPTDSGLAGLPGDYSPVSRFVKGSVLVRFSDRRFNAEQGVYRMEHVLNNFDAPYGLVAVTDQHPGGDYTQWAMIKNLHTQTLYIRPQHSLTFYQIDLADIFAKTKSFHSIALQRIAAEAHPNVSALF